MDPTCCASSGIDPREPLHAALLVSAGLTTSLGHCVGMCGPLQAVIASGPASGRIMGQAFFHSGRVLTYAAIGAILGFTGPLLRATGAAERAQAFASLGVGIAMLVLVLGGRTSAAWGSGITRRFGAQVTVRTRGLLGSSRPSRRFALGVANGLLPCGPVALVALAAASTHGPLEGGFSLILFGLGTVPVLAVVAIGAQQIRSVALRRSFGRIGAGFVIVLALQLLLRGAAALGAVPHLEWQGLVLW